jgi:glucose-1-phosphate adenylyltransferase
MVKTTHYNEEPNHGTHGRFVSLLTKDTLGLVLAGGRGSRLHNLTKWRAKPAVPFAGKFRIIDFTLSNCINSGIRQIGVLTQYKAHSLIKHIQRGWGFLGGQLGEAVELLPASQRVSEESWYAGTADAVYQNLDIIRNYGKRYILVLAGDHIYKMDYGRMLASHVEQQADLTVGCIEAPVHEARSFGVMSVDDDHRIHEFNEKPDNPKPLPGNNATALASMGIYAFNTDFLYEQIIKDADTPSSRHDFGGDIIPSVIVDYRAYAYPFRDVQSGTQSYWRDVGTVDAYWKANLELIDPVPELNLYDKNWPIWTYQEQLPPAKFIFDDEDRQGIAINSMVSGGCIIQGALIRHSLLFSEVVVRNASQIIDSVILPEVNIGQNCKIRHAIIDKGCRIEDNMTIGWDEKADAERFYVSPEGVVLVTPDMLGQALHYVR